MPLVTSENREEFNRNELSKKQIGNKDEPYYVKKTSIKKGLVGQKNIPSTDFYDVEHHKEGHYARLKKEHHAHIVAYGLNKKHPEHAVGGFSDETAKKIRAEMIAEKHPMSEHPNFHD